MYHRHRSKPERTPTSPKFSLREPLHQPSRPALADYQCIDGGDDSMLDNLWLWITDIKYQISTKLRTIAVRIRDRLDDVLLQMPKLAPSSVRFIEYIRPSFVDEATADDAFLEDLRRIQEYIMHFALQQPRQKTENLKNKLVEAFPLREIEPLTWASEISWNVLSLAVPIPTQSFLASEDEHDFDRQPLRFFKVVSASKNRFLGTH